MARHAAPEQLTCRLRAIRDVLTMALVVPLQGPAGIFGPVLRELRRCWRWRRSTPRAGCSAASCTSCRSTAGPHRRAVAREVDALISAGAVEAVTGWHISAVREAVAPVIDGRVPYAYTALYEGGEHRPGVFLTGETPDLQLGPALDWFAELGRGPALDDRRRRLRLAAPLGPRRPGAYLRRIGGTVCDEMYVPLGTTDFSGVLRRVEASGCDAVLMLLIGDDAVEFNRAFSAAGPGPRHAAVQLADRRERAARLRRGRTPAA